MDRRRRRRRSRARLRRSTGAESARVASVRRRRCGSRRSRERDAGHGLRIDSDARDRPARAAGAGRALRRSIQSARDRPPPGARRATTSLSASSHETSSAICTISVHSRSVRSDGQPASAPSAASTGRQQKWTRRRRRRRRRVPGRDTSSCHARAHSETWSPARTQPNQPRLAQRTSRRPRTPSAARSPIP